MKSHSILMVLVVCILSTASICSAEENVSNVSDALSGWTGTWVSGLNTLILSQEGNSVTGTYEKPADSVILSIQGNVSDDGKVLSGTWDDLGNITFILSEDGTEFVGTYETEYMKTMEQDSDNTWNGTLTDEQVNSENPWTGKWDAGMDTFTNLTQDGNSVTGTYTTPGGAILIIQGIVSEDGKELSGFYTNSGMFMFTLADDGKVFNGTYGYGSFDSGNDWNGTLVI